MDIQPPSQTPDQKPKPTLGDEQVQALLEINSLDTKDTSKKSNKFLVFVIALIIIVVGLALVIGSHNHSSNSPKSNSATSSKNPFTSNGSVDSEVKYCSNPIHAQTVC